MVIVNLPVHVPVDIDVYVRDGKRAIRSKERVSRQSSMRRGRNQAHESGLFLGVPLRLRALEVCQADL